MRPLPAFAAALLLALATAQAHADYVIADLGTLPGDGDSLGYGLNTFGDVAGLSKNPNGGQEVWAYYGGVLHDLGVQGVAYAVNDVGQVVGQFSGQAGVYSGGAVTYLAGVNSAALGVNNAGQVVGTYTDTRGNQRGFLLSGGTFQDVGDLGGGGATFAQGINRLGQVVGFSSTSHGTTDAFLLSGGMMTDLGTLGGARSAAYAINDSGQVVGESRLADGVHDHAFLYDGGSVRDLGVLPGFTTSYARGINDLGQVVGLLGNAPDQPRDAFLYSGGVMTDLNSLLPAGSGWQLQYAWDINDAGQISGSGFHDGQQRAFLLSPEGVSPVPEPSTLALSIAAASALLAYVGWARYRPGVIPGTSQPVR